jgi:hypothetical protein
MLKMHHPSPWKLPQHNINLGLCRNVDWKGVDLTKHKSQTYSWLDYYIAMYKIRWVVFSFL